jgi:type IV secretory pathway TraG/TraD family ATPase VirD4
MSQNEQDSVNKPSIAANGLLYLEKKLDEWLHVNLMIVGVSAVAGMLLYFLFSLFFLPDGFHSKAIQGAKIIIVDNLMPLKTISISEGGKTFRVGINDLKESGMDWHYKSRFYFMLLLQALAVGVMVKPVKIFIKRLSKKAEQEYQRDEFIRGANVSSEEEMRDFIQQEEEAFAKLLESQGKSLPEPLIKLYVGEKNVRLPRDIETRGIYISGSTGSGKTVLQKHLMRQMREQGVKMIVYDPAPEFIKEFYQEGDIVLNPFDARCANWTPFVEVEKSYDPKTIAAALIGVDPKYPNFSIAAQEIFAAVLTQVSTIDDMIMFFRRELGEIAFDLMKTRAAGVITADNPRGADATLSVLRQKLQVFNYMMSETGYGVGKEPFGLKKWVRDNNDKRWVFLVCPEDQRPTLAPLVTLWMDIVSNEIMMQTPNNELPREQQRRVALLLEELPSLPEIPSLQGLLAKGRKYGAVVIITTQDPSQLEAIYGQQMARAILQNCNTWFVFRSNAYETAKRVSDQIGQLEVWGKSYGYALGDSGDELSKGFVSGSSKQSKVAILPSEIQRIKDLCCYMICFGPYPVSTVRNIFVNAPTVAEGFVPRGDALKIRRASKDENAPEKRVIELEEAPNEKKRSFARGVITDDTIEAIFGDIGNANKREPMEGERDV